MKYTIYVCGMISESNANEPETKQYIITAQYDNCIYQTENWSNVISTGRIVHYKITLNCYSGTFGVELSDQDYETLLNNEDEIIISDIPGAVCEQVTNGWAYDEYIVDCETYTQNEIHEIHLLLRTPDDDGSECVDVSTLEENGWIMDETIYSITNGCTLTEYSDTSQ